MSNELKAGLIVALILLCLGLTFTFPLAAHVAMVGLIIGLTTMTVYMLYRLVLDILNARKK